MGRNLLFSGVLLFSAYVLLGFNPVIAAVGTTAGSFDVAPSGAATYAIPITVPPGTAGIEPEISLRYSSHAGNGLLGVGWSLSGLSRVSRCPATYAQDGFTDAVDFDDNDRLCLDGERLIAVSGEYGASGTEYRTEIEQFVKVRQSGGDLNSASTWFTVWTKNGLVKEFGRRNNSAFTVPGKPYTYLWSVDRISDTTGNFIEAKYATDPSSNEHYVDRIDYTGNDQTGLTPYNSVRFEYETRPDKSSRYMNGGSDKIQAMLRLSGIKTYSQTGIVREYNLTYSASLTSGRSLLVGLEECAYAGSGSACLPETVFDWIKAEPGWVEHSSLSGGHQGGLAIDINGDGVTDFVSGNRPHGGPFEPRTWINAKTTTGRKWKKNSAYALPKPTSRAGGTVAKIEDVNGDGLPDFVEGFSESGQATYLNTGSGWKLDNRYKLPRQIFEQGTKDRGTGRGRGVLRDLNGDGLPDLVVSSDDYVNETYLNNDSPCSDISCKWTRSPEYDLPSKTMYVVDYSFSTRPDGVHNKRGFLKDITGDGLPEYILSYTTFHPAEAGWVFGEDEFADPVRESVTFRNTGSGWLLDSEYGLPAPMVSFPTPNTGHLYSTPFVAEFENAQFKDINSDGLIDIICANRISFLYSSVVDCGSSSLNSEIDGTTSKLRFIRASYINTGNGFVSAQSYNLPELFPRNEGTGAHLFKDLNGDGMPEFIVSSGDSFQPASHETYINDYTNDCASDACKWVADPDYRLPFEFFPISQVRGAVGEFDGRKGTDLTWFGETAYDSHTVFVAKSGPSDVIKSIAPSIQDAIINIEYSNLLDSNYYTSGGGEYPEPSITGDHLIVAKSTRGDGASNSVTMRYEYEDLRVNTLGRGVLGFRKFSAKNLDTGTIETTEYAQKFPYTGMVASTNTTGPGIWPGLAQPLTKTINTLAVNRLSVGSSVRYFPYVATSDEQFFDLSVYDPTSPLTTTRTKAIYDDFGNATQVVQKQFQGSSPGIDTHTTTTTSQYTNDTSQWLLGRLTHSTVTKTNTGGASVTRETAYEYDATTGLLIAETVEPNVPDLTRRTDYTYDSFGNQTQVTVSGADINARTTSTTWDSRGQFKASISNALGHTEAHSYSDEHGGQLSLTGPNGQTTTWSYDAFGREIQQTAPDGTTVTTSYKDCSSACPVADGAFAIRTTGSDGSESLEVFDRFERKILEAKRGYDGNWIDVVFEYDKRDRVVAETAPHYRGGTQHWTVYEYDAHNRVIRSESPTNDGANAGLVTQIAYDGLITRQTDPNGKTSEKHKDAASRIVQVVDAAGNITDFEHDPYGNKTRVTDAAGNITTLTYDKLGRKIAMSDPDMGQWTYEYDVLGNLVKQTDAKSQVVQLTYDKLGRKIERIEAEGNTTWQYDTEWIGKLTKAIGPAGFEREYAYDSLGRPLLVATTIQSGVYFIGRTYDTEGRLEELTYPSGLVVRHIYNSHGYLTEIVNDATGVSYWQLDHRDAFGNIETETLGNGHSTLRSHDDARGHVDAIMTGDVMGTEVQSLTYEWDKVGNLLSRADQNQGGLLEEFNYDALYRLTSSTLNGSTNLSVTYDEIGNITSKSGVGDYSYGTGNAGPHAVTQITGARAANYSYDANGNMTNGAGRTIAWNSFNKPATISHGSAGSLFVYGPGRSRYLHILQREEDGQLVNTAKVYVGDLYERHDTGSDFENRHHIRVGDRVVATEIYRSNGTHDIHYLHRDHLGSVTAVTDAAGNLVERYAYDAFGKRRGLAWDLDSDDSLLFSTIQALDRGFTGHEHLDHVGLIHMNGRVYDPILGRFASADPFVQFPESTQGFNRYTYVNNNPLSYTDPSGLFLDDLFDSLVEAFIHPWIPQIDFASDNPRQAAAIGIMLIPGGQLLGMEGLSWAVTQGFAAGMVASGGDLEAGLMGAATAGMFYGVGSYFGSVEPFTGRHLGKTITHGLVGGVSSELRGGSFKAGFWSAGTSQILSPGIDHYMGAPGTNDLAPARVAVAAVIGGTAADIGGGKFANGAVTAAFARAFNHEAEHATGNGEVDEFGQSVADGLIDSAIRETIGLGGQSYAMCVSECIASNYGDLYQAASALSPLSAVSVGYEVASRELVVQGKRTAVRNLYGDSPNLPRGRSFGAGVRQIRTLSQFTRFNAGMAVVGFGALGFQSGAQGYCRVSCAID